MTSPERVSASVVDHRNGDQVFEKAGEILSLTKE